MTVFQAIVYGVVQGLTEFLPISSSAHLILLPWALGWQDPGLAFDVFLHAGTLCAIFIYFFKDWTSLIGAGLRSILERKVGYEQERYLFWFLVFGTIPAGLVGWLLHQAAEDSFRSPLLIAVALASVGFLLYWVDHTYASVREMDQMTWGDTFWIGLAQACAVIPGVSRSGATMLAARMRGMTREAAARFSFLLSFPIILAATLHEGRTLLTSTWQLAPGLLLGGFLASTLTGFVAIHFMMRFLRVADFGLFAWYRILLGGGIVLKCLWA